MEIDYGLALVWIVLLPLAGALINGLAGRFASKALVGAVAVGAVGLSFVLAVLSFVHLVELRETAGEGARIYERVYEWFSIHFDGREIPIHVAFTMDALSGLMTLVVTGIGSLIHIYSLGYMKDEPSYARFFTYLNLFTGSMLILVLASSMPVMFVGWEGVGLCSYLLIGFWYENPEYAQAGKKAFIVNRIGDFGVVLGMFILVGAAGSVEFDAINRAAGGLSAETWTLGRISTGMTLATAACLLLFLGCAGKSAQIPLYVWLPDAMAGPTPVSALIHAATMVTAGVYLCCRLSGVFVESPVAMSVIALVGGATALLAASIALVQNQMKKILAYSTVSQLGFMFAAVGTGAFAAGFFHVFTHAFFKACLFLGAGAVMHAVEAHGDADIWKLGGMRKYLPTVHWTFLVSCLAIAGVPLFSGFFSKDEVLLGATSIAFGQDLPIAAWVGWTVFGMLAVAATMTAYYMFRLYFVTFAGEYRSHTHAHGEEHDEEHALAHGGSDHGEHGYAQHPHHEEAAISFPLIVLGVGAIAAGWLGFPHWQHVIPNVWGEWLAAALTPLVAGAEAHHGLGPAEYTALGAGTVAALVGIGLAWSRYGTGRAPAERADSGFAKVLFHKWYVDELYDRTIVAANKGLARLAMVLDKYVVDAFLARLTAASATAFGWAFTRIQNGAVSAYGATMMVGVLAVGWWFVYPHAEVETEIEGANVKFVAARGVGYEYRWDEDSDGLFDVDWSAEAHTTSALFTTDDVQSLALVVERDPRKKAAEYRLVQGRVFELGTRVVGRGWEVPDGSGVPAAILGRGDDLVLRANGAALSIEGAAGGHDHDHPPGTDHDHDHAAERPAGGEETVLRPGMRFQIGAARIRVAAVVRATVEVRNAFGNVDREVVEPIVDVSPPTEVAAAAAGGAR